MEFKQIKTHEIFYGSLLKGFAAVILTLFVYQFFYIEFIRSSIEDSAFDMTSWFALSKTSTDTNNSNLFILMVDDNYLSSQNLLDENNETTYGYILPREYLADIITRVDTLVEDIDEENYPKALFLDYDLSYLSDPHNQVPSVGDRQLLTLLKQERPFTIYLPMTSSYNFIYHSKDEKIQELIKTKKIQFVSVGLTESSDGVSRRYYPYENYKTADGSDKKFTNVAIELWNDQQQQKVDVSNYFSQEGISLIENRIIFKDKRVAQDGKSVTWQSNWKKLSAFSANYPLDMIYEDDLRGSILFVGATHSANEDNFEIDAYSKEISGVEMHANAYMTLNYLDGKLQRVPLILSVLIILFVVTFFDFILALVHSKLLDWKNSKKSKNLKSFLTIFIANSREDFQDRWSVILSVVALFFISYGFLLSSQHYWFNWLIPAMMSETYILVMGFKKLLVK